MKLKEVPSKLKTNVILNTFTNIAIEMKIFVEQRDKDYDQLDPN